jgi:hypothetical protein
VRNVKMMKLVFLYVNVKASWSIYYNANMSHTTKARQTTAETFFFH